MTPTSPTDRPLPTPPARGPRARVRCLAPLLLLVASLFAPPAPGGIMPPLPDPCLEETTPGVLQVSSLSVASGSVEIRYNAASLASKKIALLVNGNSYDVVDYLPLATHLARNGMIAATAQRPNGGQGGTGEFVLEALQAVLDELGLDAADRDVMAGLVGHSRGGLLAADAAILNDREDRGLPIDALVGLSPRADGERVDGTDVPSYLVIYGSQDEDLSGYTGDWAHEGFRAYDDSGNEGTTACKEPPCVLASPPMERTMIYVYGADHAGLVGIPFHPPGDDFGLPQDTEYVAAADQLCIVKAYVTGFLRWKLLGKAGYEGMLRDEWRPPSVSSITTTWPDPFGNPAGSPLRQFFQISPFSRRVIENFQRDLGLWDASTDVQVQHIGAGGLDFDPSWVRHNTGAAMVAWPPSNQDQWAGWLVTEEDRDATSFTHLSLRLGQLYGSPAPLDNPAGQDQALWLAVQDEDFHLSWHPIQGLPAPDPDVTDPVQAKSAMQTVRIRVDTMDGIDPARIRAVYLFFEQDTQGTVLVDSIEWHRD